MVGVMFYYRKKVRTNIKHSTKSSACESSPTKAHISCDHHTIFWTTFHSYVVDLEVISTQQHIQTAEHDADLWQRAHKPRDLNLTGKQTENSEVRRGQTRPVCQSYIKKKEKIYFLKSHFLSCGNLLQTSNCLWLTARCSRLSYDFAHVWETCVRVREPWSNSLYGRDPWDVHESVLGSKQSKLSESSTASWPLMKRPPVM